jgi:hypothetical protein
VDPAAVVGSRQKAVIMGQLSAYSWKHRNH